MKLWLDDYRAPWKHGAEGFEWVKTGEEAIKKLESGTVIFASLDHDLCLQHMSFSEVLPEDYTEMTGYSVVCWMEETGCWPPEGVAVHSMNPVGRDRMEQVIRKHYGKNF